MKKPAPLPRAPSIKISTKAATPQRPAGAALNGNDTIVSLPSVLQPPSMPIASAPRASETPSASSAKRARAEKEDNGTPAPKRPKTESHRPSVEGEKGNKGWRKRRMVTLRTNNPKRLAVILGQSLGTSPGVRTALPTGTSKESSPGSFKDSITAKPARKPLPTGDVVRRPLPNGGNGASASPPAPQLPRKMSVDTSVAPAPAPASMAGSPPAGTPTSARTKIKIIRKPAPPPPPPT